MDATIRPLFPDQQYFNIGEAARIVRVPDYTLRYWESRLRLLRPARRESGHRRYTKRDLETVLRVKELLQNRRMTLAGARQVLLRDGRQTRGEGRTPAPAIADAGLSRLLREMRDDLRGILSELSK